jgi:hypothetical protein
MVGTAVGGTGVLVGGSGVSVGGIGVLVGDTGVLVGGTGVWVGGIGVLVGCAAVALGVAVGSGVGPQPASRTTRTAISTARLIISISLIAAFTKWSISTVGGV